MWEVESIKIATVGGTSLTTTYPKTISEDFDDDGTEETKIMSIYWYYDADNKTAYKFTKIDVTEDGGSVTETLTGPVTYKTYSYSLSGNTLTMGDDIFTVDASGTNATVTTADSDDSISGVTRMKAVLSPTFTDLLEQATAEE
jgi:hypothetical protein